MAHVVKLGIDKIRGHILKFMNLMAVYGKPKASVASCVVNWLRASPFQRGVGGLYFVNRLNEANIFLLI